MALNINFWVGLSIFGVGQGVFLSAALLFHRRGNQLANRTLALLIFLFSMRLGEFVAYWTNFFLKFPHFAFTTVSFQLLFGVLLYLYAKTLTGAGSSLKKRDLLHFLPFVLHVLWLLPFYLQDGAYKINVLKQIIYTDNPTFSTRFFIVEGLQNLQMLLYTILTVRLIKRYHQKINGAFLSLEKINLKWLQHLTIGFGVFILLDILHLLELAIFGYAHIVFVDSALMFFSAVLIYTLGYLALRQPEVFSGALAFKSSPKYEKSSLSPERAEVYLRKLIDAMEKNKLFTDHALGLSELSQKLAISPHHLSQVLNEKLQQNFFDFINSYRVEEAKRLLSEPENDCYTILSIAHEVGFNNKASFNAAFKKHTGITPSQFRNTAKEFS